MRPREKEDERKKREDEVPTLKEERSPLDGILEDPRSEDQGVASLDKALWDRTRKKSGPELAAED